MFGDSSATTYTLTGMRWPHSGEEGDKGTEGVPVQQLLAAIQVSKAQRLPQAAQCLLVHDALFYRPIHTACKHKVCHDPARPCEAAVFFLQVLL